MLNILDAFSVLVIFFKMVGGQLVELDCDSVVVGSIPSSTPVSVPPKIWRIGKLVDF